jgi:hypothetical protein
MSAGALAGILLTAAAVTAATFLIRWYRGLAGAYRQARQRAPVSPWSSTISRPRTRCPDDPAGSW